MMTSQEIRSNNLIEGINDDLSVIDQVIKLNEELINVKEDKVKNLKLSKYLK